MPLIINSVPRVHRIMLCLLLFVLSCDKGTPVAVVEIPNTSKEVPADIDYFKGADLSYVNEMEDCGAVYRQNKTAIDVFEYFSEQTANIVRVRLWHTPDWTKYSNLQDVERTMQRTKQAGMAVLLDFHYSDDWADPSKQIIPRAWTTIDDTQILGDSLYQYTYRTLSYLYQKDLVPHIVQVGNEINSEILVTKTAEARNYSMDWQRNTFLLNRGLEAVRDFSQATQNQPKTLLHIAQPENASWWFESALANGLNDFDYIGLSYYPKWSTVEITAIANYLKNLTQRFDKSIIIVETAYPYTLQDFDDANNILSSDALLDQFPATPQGQLQYLEYLDEQIRLGGGKGLIYWEPAWVSTRCNTRWGSGSHWENATFFDATNGNEVLPGASFFK